VNVLVILQGPAYRTEAADNGLRLAGNLAKRDGVDVKVFCFGDAVGCTIANHKLPDGYYHLDRMLTSAAHHGAEMIIPRPNGPASTRSPTGPGGRQDNHRLTLTRWKGWRMTAEPLRRFGLVLDCADPDRLAESWAAALGYINVGTAGGYVALYHLTATDPSCSSSGSVNPRQPGTACTSTSTSPTSTHRPTDSPPSVPNASPATPSMSTARHGS